MLGILNCIHAVTKSNFRGIEIQGPCDIRLSFRSSKSLIHAFYNSAECYTVHYTTLQSSAVQYTTVHYSIVQYTIIQYSTVHHNTVQYSTVECSRDSIVQSSKILKTAILKTVTIEPWTSLVVQPFLPSCYYYLDLVTSLNSFSSTRQNPESRP